VRERESQPPPPTATAAPAPTPPVPATTLVPVPSPPTPASTLAPAPTTEPVPFPRPPASRSAGCVHGAWNRSHPSRSESQIMSQGWGYPPHPTRVEGWCSRRLRSPLKGRSWGGSVSKTASPGSSQDPPARLCGAAVWRTGELQVSSASTARGKVI
jgi:hypothetical protein